MKDYDTYYIKYKQLKLQLQDQQIGGSKQNYYLVHGTKNLDSIVDIITDGKLKFGSNVNVDRRMYSGIHSKLYIFMNIFFEDLHNLDCFMDYSLIIHPKILKDYDMYFNKGWCGGPNKDAIVIYKNDNAEIFNKKIKKIKKYVKNPAGLPDVVMRFPGTRHHECVFVEEIDIKKYLIGVVCNHINDVDKEMLQILLDNLGYVNVKIYDRNIPFPSLKDLETSS